MAKNDVEGPIQRSIIHWLRMVMPHALIHHSVNEQHMSGGNRKMAARVGKKRKDNGMLPGFPDLIVLPYASAGGAFFLEVKAPRGSVSMSQHEVHGHMERLGYKVGVVRSIEDTRAFLQANGIGFNEITDDAVAR